MNHEAPPQQVAYGLSALQNESAIQMASLSHQQPPSHDASEMDNQEDGDDAEGDMEDSDGPPTGEDDDDGWQRVHLPKKKRPTRTDRVSRTRYTLQLRPLNKVRISKIPRQAIATVIGRTAPSAELAEMAAVTFDDAANSAHIALYDENHATRLAEIDHLTVRHNGKVETIDVVVELTPSTRNTIRGVIKVDPNDSNEAILNWLRCEQADVLKVQKIGKTDRAILTFDSPTLPKTVKYYMELVRVAEYRPMRLVCFNCHSLGHMAKFCPSPSVCKECGRSHAEAAECDSTTYCVACKETGHLAVSKVCPSRMPKKDERSTRPISTKKVLPDGALSTGPRSTPQGVTWASTVAGTSPKLPPIGALPDDHPLVIENSQLRRTLFELRAEMATMRKELAALRSVSTRRQSVSPAPNRSTPTRRSRSRTSRRKPAADTVLKNVEPSPTYITEQILTQREARLKFENNKEWQRASSEIVALQGQVTLIKEELRQFMEIVKQCIQAPCPLTPSPSESKRKKKN